MPELPEVEITARELRNKIVGQRIKDVWTDSGKMIKRPKSFKVFKKQLKGAKIQSIRRRAKNILIDLSGNKILLVHQKMTGHLLFGEWRLSKERWVSKIAGPLLSDPRNQFLHLVFFFEHNKQLALSDQRKFAKVELWNKDELENSKDFKSLGPEPLEKEFTFKKFKEVLAKKKKGKIKQILMDQKIIAGIGNIYSDEILWEARIHPFQDISKLSETELKKIYQAIKNILKGAIRLKGTSISSFRRPAGNTGGYQSRREVYQREGEGCFRCRAKIKRKKMGGRSAHFCPKCQK